MIANSIRQMSSANGRRTLAAVRLDDPVDSLVSLVVWLCSVLVLALSFVRLGW